MSCSQMKFSWCVLSASVFQSGDNAKEGIESL
jgi:hypothetical protein